MTELWKQVFRNSTGKDPEKEVRESNQEKGVLSGA